MAKQTDNFITSLTIGVVTVVIIIAIFFGYRIMLGNPDSKWGREDFTVICVDGVQYYTKTIGYRGFMAVAIDNTTLMPLECTQEGEQYGKE